MNEGAAICKREHIDVILAVGGGSVIDCAKFVSVAAFYDGDAWDIMEHKYEPTKALPILDISTISATGSDMDAGGVISNEATQEKIGFSIPGLLQPKVSFLDPTLTYSVGRRQTACGSADILSHIIETYFVPEDGSMFLLDRFKEGLMQTVVKYAPVAMRSPKTTRRARTCSGRRAGPSTASRARSRMWPGRAIPSSMSSRPSTTSRTASASRSSRRNG